MKKQFKIYALSIGLALLTLLSAPQSAMASEVKDPFVASYLKLSEALASDKQLSEFDLMEFQVKAKDAGIKDEALKAVQKLSSSKSIKDQRKAFKEVSQAAIAYAEKKNLPVFKANCPMADADWLQAKKEVRNPYYGSSMLACGTSEKL